jgi:hypothetical protein
VADTGQGRGVVCTDFDGDGAIDILIQNGYGATRLFHNGSAAAQHTLALGLDGAAPNRFGIGARVWLSANGATQMREMAAGSNFLSSNPPVAYFGLGAPDRYERLRVRWPDGRESVAGYAPGRARRIDADLVFADGVE